MKIGTITFHGAHNYGSVLQSYALQKVLLSMNHENEIINFRTENQKDLYNLVTKRKGLKYILKNGYNLLTYKNRKEKYNKFESFINNQLILTNKEYKTVEELNDLESEYDCYISGSDQIWNIETNDFELAYMLPFAGDKKRISYAPSCGPNVNFSKIKKQNVKPHINKYNHISVRDRETQLFVKELTGKESNIVLDPTLLLSTEEWINVIGDKKVKDGNYIFLYSLFSSKELITVAKKLSKVTNMPVVLSNISNQYDIFSGFEKITNSGPIDFLSLIKNAKYVVTTSYHAAIFSIIFKVPFLSTKAMNDNRFKYLLTILGLENCSVSLDDMDKKIRNIDTIDFEYAHNQLQKYRNSSLDYLKKSIGE